jgi:O-antigen/teichoic acid export membrane protein
MASTSVARLSEMGLGGGVVRFVASDLGRNDRAKAAATIGMSLLFVTAMITLATTLLFPIFEMGLERALQPQMLAEGLALLRYAAVALVLTTVANVFLSALDGMQRMDLRATIQLGSSIVQLVAALILVPAGGVQSLGPVQVITACFTLFVAAAITARQVRQPVSTWFRWDRTRAKELVQYGGGLQVAAVGQLLFDPTVKLLLTYFGGLAFTGYYEMANRMMLQFRSLIVSAYNALVPFVAGRLETSSDPHGDVRRVYIQSFRFLFVTAFAYYGVIGAALPFVLTLWLGHFELAFLAIATLCWLGWWVNTMVGPSYFLYLAIGRLRWAVTAQLAIGVFNLIFAWTLGLAFGGWGVLVGSALGLALGSSVTLIAFQAEHHISPRVCIPIEALPLAVTTLIGSVACIFLATRLATPSLIELAAGPALLGIVAAIMLLFQPVYRDLWLRVRTGFA